MALQHVSVFCLSPSVSVSLHPHTLDILSSFRIPLSLLSFASCVNTDSGFATRFVTTLPL